MITKDDVSYIANLSNIRIGEQDKELFVGHLNTILQYVDQLGELDEILEKDNIQPTMHAWDSTDMVLREDEIKPSMDAQDILKESADARSGSFAVPKVIEVS